MSTRKRPNDKVFALREKLKKLDAERAEVARELARLEREQAGSETSAAVSTVTRRSSSEAKICLFRGLFRGREDVYPKRWENNKTGKAGYAPACDNEWVKGFATSPESSAATAPTRHFFL